MDQQAKAEVARTVRAKRKWLRNASAPAVLAMLSAAAFAPDVAAAASGAGAAVALTTLAGVAGNIGAGHLTNMIERAADRIRGTDAPDAETARDALAGELLAVLERNDTAAQELSIQLTDLLMSIDGIPDALGAAGSELRDYLVGCFAQLTGQHAEAMARLEALSTGQRQELRHLRQLMTLTEETVDRLRRQEHADWLGTEPPTSGAVPPTLLRPVVVTPGGAAGAPAERGWRGGADVAVGDRVYLIHDVLAEEQFTADHSAVLRQAQGQQLIPAPGPDGGYVWLRQAERKRDSAAARAALRALAAENDLLGTLRTVGGMPQVRQLAAEGALVSLVLTWPMSRSGAACPTLGVGHDLGRDSAGPMDSWRMYRLFTGLAGLCTTLARLHSHHAAHRNLSPAGIIGLDNGRLMLRDLGLAARSAESGEGPADYQSPEQRRQARYRPGPATDVYQLAAVTYHLITGHPPPARAPLPVQAQAPGIPGRAAAALDAALAPNPGGRPDVLTLGGALRAAADEIRLTGEADDIATCQSTGLAGASTGQRPGRPTGPGHSGSPPSAIEP